MISTRGMGHIRRRSSQGLASHRRGHAEYRRYACPPRISEARADQQFATVSHHTNAPATRPYVIYVTYDGVAEPLGRSQILAYLRHLAINHRITLISFEKDDEAADQLGAELATLGIHWVRLRYHRRPPVLSTVLDIGRGRRALMKIARSTAPDVVHVRSDVPALIAHLARHRTRAPMLFDIRGFWADERVEGGLWRAGGVLHRIARRCEPRFYADAGAVVDVDRSISAPDSKLVWRPRPARRGHSHLRGQRSLRSDCPATRGSSRTLERIGWDVVPLRSGTATRRSVGAAPDRADPAGRRGTRPTGWSRGRRACNRTRGDGSRDA